MITWRSNWTIDLQSYDLEDILEAAGQSICKHAGFQVIDWSTKSMMLYNREDL